MADTSTDDPALKDRLRATWAAGDYARIAEPLAASAEAFLDRLRVEPGERLLDIACGAGQIARPAARRGARATGVDIVEALVREGATRARQEGLDVRFEVGDAEALPFEDASFDHAISLIGAMFALNPDRVAAEMLRVTRPGGRIAMGNWTPEGFIGDFFRTVAAHVPPPPMPSPLLWGNEEVVRERFGDGVRDLVAEPTTYRFRYPMPPEAVVEHFRENFGPVVTAMGKLDAAGRAALEADLVALWRGANEADGEDEVIVHAGILEVRATRA